MVLHRIKSLPTKHTKVLDPFDNRITFNENFKSE